MKKLENTLGKADKAWLKVVPVNGSKRSSWCPASPHVVHFHFSNDPTQTHRLAVQGSACCSPPLPHAATTNPQQSDSPASFKPTGTVPRQIQFCFGLCHSPPDSLLSPFDHFHAPAPLLSVLWNLRSFHTLKELTRSGTSPHSFSTPKINFLYFSNKGNFLIV